MAIYLITAYRSMKFNTTPILAVSLAVVVVFLGFSLSGVIDTKHSMTQTGMAEAYMTGHVETVVRDSDGNIKEYRQSDNVIVNTGENCVAKLLFQDDGAGAGLGSGTGTSACIGSLNQPWTSIVLGNDTTAASGTQTGLGVEHRGNSLVRAKATTITFTNSTTASGASTDRSIVTLAKTFTNNSGGSNTVSESGLFNSTTVGAGGMFARQQFSAITLSSGDSLTVTWTINIGNAATFTSS